MHAHLEAMVVADELACSVRSKLMRELSIMSRYAICFSGVTPILFLSRSSFICKELFPQSGGAVLKALPLLRGGGGADRSELLAMIGQWCDGFGEERVRRCQELKR